MYYLQLTESLISAQQDDFSLLYTSDAADDTP